MTIGWTFLIKFSLDMCTYLHILTKLFWVSDIAKVTHIHLALDVDFDRKILAGSATLSVEKVDSAATQVILDARGMKIASAVDDSNGANLDFVIHPEDYVGSKMEVPLPKSTEKV